MRFYVDALGLAPERLEEFRRGEVMFPSVRINADTLIDFFARDAAAPGGENLDHFCLTVAPCDLAQVATRLAAHGATMEGQPTQHWGARGDARSLYLRDPEGNRVEVRFYAD